MSGVSAALSGLEKCEVVVTNKTRSIDNNGKGFGEITTTNGAQCVLEGLISESELEKINLYNTGSIGLLEAKVYFEGKVELKLDDTVKINDLTQEVLTVHEVKFRRSTGVTKAVVKSITRRVLN